MEHLTLPGDASFTPPEGKKLTDRINKLGVKVESIRGVWLYYIHLRQSDPDFVKVSLFFVLVILLLLCWNMNCYFPLIKEDLRGYCSKLRFLRFWLLRNIQASHAALPQTLPNRSSVFLNTVLQ
jgi:hypothetical protein